jgi:NAD-dependent dihydropyrimidine dehydrogenase PreA subunit
MTFVIALPCVDLKDKACLDACPIDCIGEGDRMLYINPEECIDCGACEPVCPVEAIAYEDDLLDGHDGYTKINAEFFAMIGSPGPAHKVGPVPYDHPLVAALPPQAPAG